MPKITVITRKAYGGAYCVMASKHIRTDVNLRVSLRRDRRHGARGGGQRSSTGGSSPKRPAIRLTFRTASGKVDEYRDKFSNPYVAAERGFVTATCRSRQYGTTDPLVVGSRVTVSLNRNLRQSRIQRRIGHGES